MRPGAAASCRGARSSPVRRPPAAPAAAPTERPCALPPKADPGQSRDGLGGVPGRAAGGAAPVIVVGAGWFAGQRPALAGSMRRGNRTALGPRAPVFVVPPASQPARYAAG